MAEFANVVVWTGTIGSSVEMASIATADSKGNDIIKTLENGL